jgi:hypothetical protein
MGDFLKLCWLATILVATVYLHAGQSSVDAQDAPAQADTTQDQAPQPDNRFMLPLELIPDPSNLFSQLDQMNQLIALPTEQLKQLRLTIEFLEKLSPEERESMRRKLAEISIVSNARKSEVRHLIPYLPPRFHSDLSQLWMSASAEERATIQKDIEPLSNWDKGQYLIKRVQEYVTRREAVYSELVQSLEKEPSAGSQDSSDKDADN